MMVKRRSFFITLLPAILMIVLQEMMSMFAMQIVMIKEFASAKDGFDMSVLLDSLTKTVTTQGFLMVVSCMYAAVGILIYWAWYKSKPVASSEENGGFVHNDRLKGYSVLLYVGIAIFAIAAQYVCAYILTITAKAFPAWVEVYDETMKSIEPQGGYAGILSVLFVAFLGPVCEELCFRGVTYSLARYSMPHWGANIMQAILFAGVHANPLQSIYTFIFALILGNIVGKTGNILITILIHICFNGASVLLEGYIGVGDTAVSFYCIMLIALIGTYLGYMMIMHVQGKYEANIQKKG